MELNIDDTQRSIADDHTPRRSGWRRRASAESDGDAAADSRTEDQHRSEGRSRNSPRSAETGSVPGGQVDGHSSFVVQWRAGNTTDAGDDARKECERGAGSVQAKRRQQNCELSRNGWAQRRNIHGDRAATL